MDRADRRPLRLRGATIVRRLGTYRCLEMGVTIKEALDTIDVPAHHLAADTTPPPAFVADRLT